MPHIPIHYRQVVRDPRVRYSHGRVKTAKMPFYWLRDELERLDARLAAGLPVDPAYHEAVRDEVLDRRMTSFIRDAKDPDDYEW